MADYDLDPELSHVLESLWTGRRRLAVRRPFELYDIALRISEVNRDAVALGAKARPDVANGHAVLPEMRGDRMLVERLDAQAQVIHVATFVARSGATLLAERPCDRDEVDHRGAGAQMRHAELGTVSNMLRAEHIAIKLRHRIDVAHSQNDVIYFAQV